MEQKVYSAWAYTENSDEKVQINQKIYKELRDKVKIGYRDSKIKGMNISKDDLQNYCCLVPCGRGYGNVQYQIISNPHNLSNDEIALVADGGNLCFGYRAVGSTIVIYTD